MGSNAVAINGLSSEIGRSMNVVPQVNKGQPDTQRVNTINTVKELDQAKLSGDLISISDEQLIRAIERAIAGMRGVSTSLDFSVHKTTKQIMVKVLNSDTGEVIREIPPEKSLDFLAKVWEQAGILVDERR